MTEIIISAGVSALLVLIEAMGIILSKWTLTKRSAESFVHHAEARAALEFDASQLAKGEEAASVLAERLRIASNTARSEHLRRSLAGVLPGPELCFLSMTIVASLFLAFNYSNEQLRLAMSPVLASTKSAFPILFGVFLLNLVMWIGVLLWREAIVMGIQRRFVPVSMAIIIAVGGGAMTLSIYLLIASR